MRLQAILWSFSSIILDLQWSLIKHYSQMCHVTCDGGRHVPGGIGRWARLLGRWVAVGGTGYIIYEFLGM